MKFVTTLFTEEKGGSLKTSRQEQETYLIRIYADDKGIAITTYMTPTEETEHKMDTQ